MKDIYIGQLNQAKYLFIKQSPGYNDLSEKLVPDWAPSLRKVGKGPNWTPCPAP